LSPAYSSSPERALGRDFRQNLRFGLGSRLGYGLAADAM